MRGKKQAAEPKPVDSRPGDAGERNFPKPRISGPGASHLAQGDGLVLFYLRNGSDRLLSSVALNPKLS